MENPTYTMELNGELRSGLKSLKVLAEAVWSKSSTGA